MKASSSILPLAAAAVAALPGAGALSKAPIAAFAERLADADRELTEEEKRDLMHVVSSSRKPRRRRMMMALSERRTIPVPSIPTPRANYR